MPAYEGGSFSPPAPVARIVVRHSETGSSVPDVTMLIDSGADVTLIPKLPIATLGLVGAGQHYQLVAFDGTARESEAVQADIVFLNKRFHGRYLLVEGEVGILGRDILNHLRLLLDGPMLAWEESSSSTKKA